MNCNLQQSLDPPFKETFHSAVEKAMLLLGESGKQATYYHIEKVLATIKKQLKKQRREQKMTEKQLVQYIETRVKQIEQKS